MREKNAVGNLWQRFIEYQDNYDAFSEIYNLYIDDLLSYGISLGFSEDISRDAAHDVFFKIFTEKKRLTSVKNPTAYLFRSFRNHLFNIKKKQNKLSYYPTFKETSFATEITILDTIISEEEKEKLKKLVEEILKELTPRQQEAIYLRYMQELDYEEIALMLNINVNSARRLVSRGLGSLRNRTFNGDNEYIPLLLLFALLIHHRL